MADNTDEDSSSFQRTVILRDWWLIKCSNEFNGKPFGVAGTQQQTETRGGAVRVFESSPIIKALDVFTLEASDGVCIRLRGFLNKQRLVQSGFLLEISREFIFGFPPCWEAKCHNCFVGEPSGINITASRKNLSPCNNIKWNLEDSPAEKRDDSTVIEKNTKKFNDKDGLGGSSTEKSVRKKSLRLQSKSVEGLSKAKSGGVEKDEGNERKLDENKVEKRTNGGDHVSEGLDKAKSSDVEKDEREVISNEVILPADGCGKKHTVAVADNVDKKTSASATGESLTSEQGKGELEATKACPYSLFEDLEKSGTPGKKAISKKSGKTLRSDGNVVEHVDHSGTTVKTRKNKRKLDVSEVQDPTTDDVGQGSAGLSKAKGNGIENVERMDNEEMSPVDGYGKTRTRSKKLTSKKATKGSLTSEERKGKLKVTKTSLLSSSKDVSKSSKPGKKGKSKKSEKIVKGDLDVVEPMTHSGSKVKDNLSMGKTIRKINFDEEELMPPLLCNGKVTPDKDAKKQKTNILSPDSLGHKRSRSGRVLVSPLAYWRNQVAVYDLDRNFIQVNERSETNSTASKGKRSVSRKPRR